MCPNGRRITRIIEYKGESACDFAEKPFRCIDGTFASSLSERKVAFREVGNNNVLISIFPKMEINSDIIIEAWNIVSRKISIPA